MTDYRDVIVNELTTLMKKEQQERNVFKARAYGKVISQVKALDKPITSADDIQNIEGVGEKIREKLKEILATGKLAAAEKIREDKDSQILEALNNVYGIGPVKAKQLLQEHPVKTMEEFRAVVAANPDLLHEKQKIGLKYYEDFLERIPRKEMTKHEAFLVEATQKADARLHCDIVGSYRRGAKDSGDIDMLVGFPEEMPEQEAVAAFHKLIQTLTRAGYIKEELALGSKKFMGVCKLPRHRRARRLDLLLTNAQEYPYALLYFTGSQKYNIAMRKHALTMGYTVNEHGMKPVRADVPEPPKTLKTEEEVVAFLGLEYIPPSKRV